jgi:copper transporter 1
LEVLFVFACLPSFKSIRAIIIVHRYRSQMPIMHRIAGQYVLSAFLITGAVAHDNGMNMNMDQGMSMNVGNMIMYLHFKLGDNLWFLGWTPTSAGAMVGTCIGLLMLSITERWLAAMRGVMDAHWRTRFVLVITSSTICFLMHWLCSAQVALTNKLNTSAVGISHDERTRPPSRAPQLPPDMAMPFVLAYDVPRGIMQIGLATINFLLMLTIM